MVDTGLMRKDEFKLTYKIFKNKYNLNVKLVNSSKTFLKKLKNISNPEKKEKLLVNYLLKFLKKRQKKRRELNFLHKALFILILSKADLLLVVKHLK